jgi:hypothetical protein
MTSGAKGCVTAYDVYVRYCSKYVSICNMLALFKFAIPVINDYGSAIKLGDYTVWKKALQSLLCFTLCVKAQVRLSTVVSLHKFIRGYLLPARTSNIYSSS